jgi:hypothetical protein
MKTMVFKRGAISRIMCGVLSRLYEKCERTGKNVFSKQELGIAVADGLTIETNGYEWTKEVKEGIILLMEDENLIEFASSLGEAEYYSL